MEIDRQESVIKKDHFLNEEKAGFFSRLAEVPRRGRQGDE